MKLSLLGFEELDLGPGIPTLGGFSVKERGPCPFRLFGKERGGRK